MQSITASNLLRRLWAIRNHGNRVCFALHCDRHAIQKGLSFGKVTGQHPVPADCGSLNVRFQSSEDTPHAKPQQNQQQPGQQQPGPRPRDPDIIVQLFGRRDFVQVLFTEQSHMRGLLLKPFLNRKDVLPILIFIGNLVHALFDHVNTQSANLAFLCRKGRVRVGLCQRVIRLPAVHEGD